MRINRKVEYALIALKHMNQKRPGELTSVKEIAELYGCPGDVLAKVLQTLSRKQILKSEQGTFGGYHIQKDLSKVSLHDLFSTVLGPQTLVKCLQVKNHDCEIKETCNILGPIANLNARMEEFYRGLTIQEILQGKKAKANRVSMLEEHSL